MAKIDLAKRRRIMQRSMKLGHCICDPKRPCPCDIFTDQGICPCAGERPDPIPAGEVKLTELVHNTGCASKIAAGDLQQVLDRLPPVNDPAVLSGIPAGDDAGVYALTDEVTLVQTLDVFTPCVDDPYTFGRICAANCLSDIYAMGGVPRTALSVLGFPAETLDGQIMYQMMAGAMAMLAEADVALIGGHSIKDEEIKLGFAITGTIETAAVERGGAKTGDVLILTKSLGTGVLNFAHQIGRTHEVGLARAAESMATLNRLAAEAMTEVGASACTDITGFGLFGHLVGMVRHSEVTAHVYADVLPAFDGALEALADEVVPGAIERNTEYVGDDILIADGVDPARVHLGYDAQTSGGLLIAVGAENEAAMLAALGDRGVPAVVVGKITAASTGRIVVTNSNQSLAAAGKFDLQESDMPDPTPEPTQASSACCCASAPKANSGAAESCCGDVSTPAAAVAQGGCCSGSEPASSSAPASSAAESLKAFGSMMRAAGSAGSLDERTKELITFALVLLSRCSPCVAVHLNKARAMGISQAELDEAAWCAVAMGGAPVKLFYDEALRG